MNILIRPIQKADYFETTEVIKRSNRESLGKIYPHELIDEFCKKYDVDKFEKKALDVEYFIAVDVETHKILGVIGLKHNELRTFFVDPKYQGKGIGRKLYDYLEKKARERGLTELALEGSPLGEPIYERFGFKKIGTLHKERLGIAYSDAQMVKKLT
jgi:GNAT superfamily N-acetyltransferase